MPKLKLRNAYLRGWFAARSERGLPEPDGLAEKVFIDRGYEAGIESGGRALAMLDNPESDAASAEVDVDAVIKEYRARKAAQQALAESQGVERPRPAEEAPLQEPAPQYDAAESDATASDKQKPAIEPRRSRWDDDNGDAGIAAKEMTGTSPGPRRRYGH